MPIGILKSTAMRLTEEALQPDYVPSINYYLKDVTAVEAELTRQMTIQAQKGYYILGWVVHNMNPSDAATIVTSLQGNGFTASSKNIEDEKAAVYFEISWR